MTNRLGVSTVGTNGHAYLILDCLEGLGVIVDLPCYLQGIPPGMVVYIDHDGRVQAMDDPDGV